MNTNRSGWFIGMLISALISASFAPLRSNLISANAPSEGGIRVIVGAAQPQDMQSLQAAGGQILADYGEFQLIDLPPGAPIPAGARPVDDVIHLRGFDLNTRQPDISALAPQLLENIAPGAEGFWMVQFAGPIKDEWLRGLRSQGLEIVAYMPEYAYVVWGKQPNQRTQQAMAENPLMIWQGAYQPAYRLDEHLRTLAVDPSTATSSDVTVQIYRTKHSSETIARLTALAEEVLRPPSILLQYTNLSLRLPTNRLVEVAGLADVFDVETYSQPVLLDEAQGQIAAGNLSLSGGNIVPTGPGYLAWLTSKGFPTTPNSYPIVDVVDDGIDAGFAEGVLHPDFYELGDETKADRVAYLLNCTSDLLPDGLAGHGNINAGIVGGYNNKTGSSYEDATGYNYGLGISPFGRIAGTKMFNNLGSSDLTNCGTETDAASYSYIKGARITNNSWGYNSPLGGYTAVSQMYDVITRDAVNSIPGYQQMLHVFSAGNSGSSGTTITPPATAKNVLSVGATENVREQGSTDGCGVSNANNADDIAQFSSRGPTIDSRAKPDIMAAGTHVQGPASQDPGYDGSGVCNLYHPASQTLYTWSSGTSHSAPAVAGAAQLAYEYYGRVLNPGATPSPAMLKALLLNSPRYMTGSGAGGNLPSPNQGWGDVDLGRLFDGAARQVIDQTTVFNNSGETVTYQWQVIDPTKPVRATLVWTDAPGATTGNAYVNNLDLEVTVGGQTYRGNVFSGANSTAGGTFDLRNNVENVFLPAGQSGAVTVKVTAANIAGDGLPGSGDSTDQDFALIVYNAGNPLLQALELSAVSWNDSLGNKNGLVDPGDRLSITVELHNKGSAQVQGINGILNSAVPGVTFRQQSSKYADIPGGGTQSNFTTFIADVSRDLSCGTSIQLQLDTTANLGNGSLKLPLLSFGALNPYHASGLPLIIPDADPAGIQATISVPISALVGDVNVLVNASHTWDSDLAFTLVPPVGSPISLIANRGYSGLDFQNTLLDDEAATAIADGTAPFTGAYQPEQRLSTVDGINSNGSWTLRVVDSIAGDEGTLTGFDLLLSTCNPVGVTVTPAKVFKASNKGNSVIYTLTVTNTGSGAGSFNINLSGQSWTSIPSAGTIGPLAPGGSAQFTVTVQIPASATGADQVIVDIISQTNPLSRQSAVLTTGSGILFLPLVIR